MDKNKYDHIYDGSVIFNINGTRWCKEKIDEDGNRIEVYYDFKKLCDSYFNCQNRNMGFCLACLKSCNIADMSRHYCEAPFATPKKLRGRIDRGLSNLRLSVIHTILSLKPLLGKDVAIYIGKMVYLFRKDILLYKPDEWWKSKDEKRKRRGKGKYSKKEVTDMIDCEGLKYSEDVN